jgi:hypothetical protein
VVPEATVLTIAKNLARTFLDRFTAFTWACIMVQAEVAVAMVKHDKVDLNAKMS